MGPSKRIAAPVLTRTVSLLLHWHELIRIARNFLLFPLTFHQFFQLRSQSTGHRPSVTGKLLDGVFRTRQVFTLFAALPTRALSSSTSLRADCTAGSRMSRGTNAPGKTETSRSVYSLSGKGTPLSKLW